ncbi:MAG: hypothetical protein IJF74_00760 [Clostridia bacterium]|nr:hypothetical protein [Clostridia bacterium]
MRKLVRYIAACTAALCLCSCSTLVLDAPVGSYGPIVETEQPATETTNEFRYLLELSGYDDGQVYPLGYEGMYERLVNRAYRAMQDLEFLRECGTDVSRYTEIENALAALIKGKAPTYLYPYMPTQREELPLYMGFTEPLSKLMRSDEERFVAEPELVDLFVAVRAFNSKNGLETGNDSYKRYCEFDKIIRLLMPRAFRVANESYDSELGQITLKFYADEGWDILVYCGIDGSIGYKPYSNGEFRDGVIYVKSGEEFKLEAPFPEKIYFAPINEHGIIGMRNVYYLKTAPTE